ncbi:hypothetical protein BDV93DRAFT_285260 [Ceratobasidium sp. AG-I]|nr:hypothetical protein BDV93DRAFT_285260 [Ceratobasidium sp. AG-I]
MSRVSLPPDLVRSIAEYLHDDPKTLASLCFLEKQSFDLVTPLLYKSVQLPTVQSIRQFCNTILRSERNLGTYPASILHTPEDPTDVQLWHMIDLIQNALRQMPNLTDLVLEIDTPNITNLYQHLQLEPSPFFLQHLTCFFFPYNLLSFLSTQPSIRTLIIHESRHHLLSSNFIRTVPPSILPRLQHVTANALTIHAFLPGRPVSHVDTGSAILSSGTARIFCECLKESSAPRGVESVSVCVPQTGFWTDASDFMTRLAKVCGTSIRVLKVRMPDLPVGADILGGYTTLVEVLAASLNGFSQLGHFQFEGMDGLIQASSGTVGEIGRVGTLTFWTEQCGSLHRVTLFGIDLY